MKVRSECKGIGNGVRIREEHQPERMNGERLLLALSSHLKHLLGRLPQPPLCRLLLPLLLLALVCLWSNGISSEPPTPPTKNTPVSTQHLRRYQ